MRQHCVLLAATIACLVAPAMAAPFHEKPGSCGYSINSGFAGVTRQAKVASDGMVISREYGENKVQLSPARLKQLHRLFEKSGFFSWQDGAIPRHPDASSWYVFYDDGKRSKAVSGPGGPPPMAAELMKRIDELTKTP